jgi:sugar/nucleoside kinase (ribokinase family)
MPTPPPVISAGIIVVDHIASPVPAIPRAGELLLADDCQLAIGGCAANVAIDLAKLGVACRVVGVVGSDLFGEFAVRTLDRPSIDASAIVRHPSIPTSQTLVINVQGQDRRFIHLAGANRAFSADQLRASLMPGTRVLYVGGFFLMDSLLPAELADRFRDAQSMGITTLLDVVTPGPGNYLPALQTVLPHTDYFLPNTDEAALMTGECDPVRQALALRGLGARTCIITEGAAGLSSADERGVRRYRGFTTHAVDSTGGGDAFTAGLISAIIEGCDADTALSRGAALGASCVRAMGATEGVFDRAQLDAFLNDHTFEPKS